MMSDMDNSNSNNAASPLTSVQIAKILERCRDIVVEVAGERFSDCLASLDEQLLEFATDANTDAEQMQYFDVQRDFRKKSDPIQQLFGECLAGFFIQFANGQLNTRTGEEKYSRDILSLVDNEDLEETIAISSITHTAGDNFGEALWVIGARLGQLRGGIDLPLEQNPVSPVHYCEALRQTLQAIECATKIKILTYRTFNKIFMPVLEDLYSQLNAYLAEQGILPELSYSASMASGYADVGSGGDVDTGELTEDPNFDDVLAAGQGPAATMQQPVASGGAAQGGMRLPMAGHSPIPSNPLASNAPPEQYQQNLFNAIRLLQSHVTTKQQSARPILSGGTMARTAPAVGGNQLAADDGFSASWITPGAPSRQGFSPSRAGVPLFSSGQLVQALQGLQQGINSSQGALIRSDALQPDVDTLPTQSVAQVSQQFSDQLVDVAEEEGQAVDTSDMQIIDLVGMLFDYMLSDDNLPNTIKALLSYLHTPFLKIAFIDPGFFEKTDHPARLLLNSLAEAGTRWVSNDGTAQYEIYPRIKGVVSRVLEEFQNDVRLFAELLLEFSGYTKKIARRQDLIERRAMEKVQGEEKLREVKIKVNGEISQRIENTELPSAVLLLLLQPWSDYLVFVLLRFGDESEDWDDGLHVVDDIIWSVQPKTKNEDKARQMELHEGLYDKLGLGFDTIAYDQAKANKLTDALFALQKMALQSQPLQFAPEPMRSKLETMAAEKAGASDHQEDISEDEQRMVDSLKMIEFGTWFEFGDGKRLKVAWYNSTTLHYMLVDQMGKKVGLKSGLELARDMLSGEAKVISGATKPFFERALENIFQSLNAKVEQVEAESRPEEGE